MIRFWYAFLVLIVVGFLAYTSIWNLQDQEKYDHARQREWIFQDNHNEKREGN